jgi:hypothetical protein
MERLSVQKLLLRVVFAVLACVAFGASIERANAYGFEQSCTHIAAQGFVVHALCMNHTGAMTPTAIDVRGCVGDVANVDGRLECARAGAGAPGAPFQPAFQPQGHPTTCSAPANAACGGCSVQCPPGKQALCKEGEDHGVTSPLCWTKAKCECQ